MGCAPWGNTGHIIDIWNDGLERINQRRETSRCFPPNLIKNTYDVMQRTKMK